jgi:hypothetical protein
MRTEWEWVGSGGRLQVARVRAAREAVPGVVCVQDREMRGAWCLATGRRDLAGDELKSERSFSA